MTNETKIVQWDIFVKMPDGSLVQPRMAVVWDTASRKFLKVIDLSMEEFCCEQDDTAAREHAGNLREFLRTARRQEAAEVTMSVQPVAVIPPEWEQAFDLLMADYLRMEQPRLSDCVRRVRAIAAQIGIAVPDTGELVAALRAEHRRDRGRFISFRQGTKAASAYYAQRERGCWVSKAPGMAGAMPSPQPSLAP